MTNEINLTVNDNGNLTFNGVEYAHLSHALGFTYHTASLRTLEECRKVKSVYYACMENLHEI